LGGSGSSSTSSLAGGSRAKRNNLTSSVMSSTTSVVSNCLLSSLVGGGDGISLDPEVDTWLDIIPLSRKPFKNFHRDFADGVLMAEIMAYFFPKRVDLHNYVPASASSGKKANYDTLNQKVFSKMGVKLADNLIDGIIHAKPGYIEKALLQVHRVIDNVDRKHVETRAKELCCLAGSFDGSQSLHAPFIQELCLVRSLPGEIPDCVIYQNIKYYPSTTLEENSKTEKQLLEKNNELSNKVRRLETLLGLKESHLQDLTSKIHELRANYESSQHGLPEY